ncbi:MULTISPECIES: ABC transporter permease [Cohnella]|uniref:Putative aldouronate transport system permease protein n=1 Tax=Cohnella phaseoli TaxID=456490 RepID=A0A3D9KIW2_9BACL|nr:ABC transporter permease subunit [Cohnella phaseoli]RED85473.1 putative aldouronate transport system permease protein [Cohnella phaseoli]
MRGSPLMKEWTKNKVLFLMVLPAIVYYFLFSYLPLAGMVLAFKNYRFDSGIFGSPWAGFNNFEFFFKSGKAWLVTSNTVLYNAAFIVSGLILQILVAIVVAEIAGRYVKKLMQTTLLFPFFLSWVVVGSFVYNLFNYDVGSINGILRALGIEPVDFYGNPNYWSYILLFFNNWKYIGYNSLIYLAVIVGIDKSLFEAAEIDGASIFQRIRAITLPLMIPTVMILLLLSIGNIFRGNFDLFYQIVGNNGLLFDATDVIDTYVFRSLIHSQDIGMSAAAGLYQSVLCFAIIMTSNFIVKRIQPDYSLF